jgi:hypothetical protein
MAHFGRSEPCCHIKLDQKELRIGTFQHLLSVEPWSQSFLTIWVKCDIVSSLSSKKATSLRCGFFIGVPSLWFSLFFLGLETRVSL